MTARQVHTRTYRCCPGCGLVLMDRTGVVSSSINTVGWEKDEDGANGIMEVEFNSGVVYQYVDVPEWVYRQLLFAPSPGRFLNANVVNVYEGQQIG